MNHHSQPKISRANGIKLYYFQGDEEVRMKKDDLYIFTF